MSSSGEAAPIVLDRPHPAISFGFFYFLIVGLRELLLVIRLEKGEKKRRG